MSALWVIGVDPGLASVGLALLFSEGPEQHIAAAAVTQHTDPARSLVDRLREIFEGVREFATKHAPVDAIVVENTAALPDKARRGRKSRASAPETWRNPRDLANLHVATGVALAAALDHPTVALFDVAYWMPRTRSGRLEHTMKREDTLRFLRQAINFSAFKRPPSEHVVMAAGLARRWIDDEWLRRKRLERGVVIP